jgi:hypothetical protein
MDKNMQEYFRNGRCSVKDITSEDLTRLARVLHLPGLENEECICKEREYYCTNDPYQICCECGHRGTIREDLDNEFGWPHKNDRLTHWKPHESFSHAQPLITALRKILYRVEVCIYRDRVECALQRFWGKPDYTARADTVALAITCAALAALDDIEELEK